MPCALGVRSWRGAIVLSSQLAAVLLVLFVVLKLSGVTDSPWVVVLLTPLGPALGMFVVVSLYAASVAALHDQKLEGEAMSEDSQCSLCGTLAKRDTLKSLNGYCYTCGDCGGRFEIGHGAQRRAERGELHPDIVTMCAQPHYRRQDSVH
jgi:hypothetical protein